ncbi:MAG: M28 family peptidase [Xanthomonadales bacterium]|nr:M28 family peptidase [Gammaproteobacteria bacterium]MBT8072371.1 M28 family peptidase [Gammaproteobacteria bacterium]NNK03211.1 M28 family peptidase [Xanthomonadales bacterium]
MRTLFITLIALLLTGCDTPAPEPVTETVEPETAVGETSPGGLALPAGFDAAEQTIQADNLLADVSKIAGDEFEGRGAGSEGDRMARAHLAGRLAQMGYAPFFADDSYEQPVEIVGLTVKDPVDLQFSTADGASVSYSFGDEYMIMAGMQEPGISVKDAEVVFAGYGIQAPEENWDDFKDVDLTGKILLLLNDDPDWDPELFGGDRKLSYGRWDYKYASAARQGAAGAIIIHTTESAGYPWQVVRASNIGEQFELKAGDEARTLFNGWLSWEGSNVLAALGGFQLEELIESARSRDFKPVPLGVTTSVDLAVEVTSKSTANVGGILHGSDPELAREVLVLSAHHDHFGIGEPDETGDTIYNGALDNGVAIAETLAIADAFAALPEPPRRSVLVLFPAVEEQGSLGSRYFANSGVIHPGLLVANINIELGNVWGRTRDVIVYGLGKSELDDWLTEAAKAQNRSIRGEQDVKAGWFYRSDQISFARAGVPAIWFKSGVDFIGREPGWGEQQYADWIKYKYHTPGDEVEDSWNLDGLTEDARLAFRLAAAVANADVTPTWYAGDEFEAVRKASLQEL